MSAPEASQFAPFERESDAPTFDETWHAQVLALAYILSESGVFTPTDWSKALGDELHNAACRGAADNQETYYAAALAALERLVSVSGVSAADLSKRVEVWRRAYLNTPHGRPVELAARSAVIE